jgi:hypothetical protein
MVPSHKINYLLFGPAGTIGSSSDLITNDDFQDQFVGEEVAMSEEAPEYITNDLHSPLCNQSTSMRPGKNAWIAHIYRFTLSCMFYLLEDGIHQYHIQIVPTRYQDLSGRSNHRAGNMGGINTKPGRRIHSQYSSYERHLKVRGYMT